MGHEQVDQNIAVQVGGRRGQRQQHAHCRATQRDSAAAPALRAYDSLDVGEEAAEDGVGGLDAAEQLGDLGDRVMEAAAAHTEEYPR